MTNWAETVSDTRVGDEFHYLWAARKCLGLLNLHDPIDSVSIEGRAHNDPVRSSSEEIIDVAIYKSEAHRSVRYVQLKHSKKRLERPAPFSELKKTFEKFAQHFRDGIDAIGIDDVLQNHSYEVVSNRAISQRVKKGLQALAADPKAATAEAKKIRSAAGLNGKRLASFCKLVRFVDDEPDYVGQREKLTFELQSSTTRVDGESLVDRLIGLVRAAAIDPTPTAITQESLLTKLGVYLDDLFPAPPELEELGTAIERKQLEKLHSWIESDGDRFLIHATGGVGKSIIAQQLAKRFQVRGDAVLYDCFAGGAYRNPSTPRHQHGCALVQIANEMAARGLCATWVPTGSSKRADQYIKEFRIRLADAAQALRSDDPNANLVVFIDAADNAEDIAENDHSFAFDLLQEAPPIGVKIVLLCRTERIHLLSPPYDVKKEKLQGFSLSESREHLLREYPSASETDIGEFHRLSQGNARLQSIALSSAASLAELLSDLGPSPATLNDAIERQLEINLSRLKASASNAQRNEIDLLCIGLASLPPFVPLGVLADITGISTDAILSFVTDFSPSIRIQGDGVQFRDEPTETWFRKTFEADTTQREMLLDALRPLTAESVYAAACLPRLLLRTGRFDELIEASQTDKFLPRDLQLDRRQIMVQRLEFALRAALKRRRFKDAATVAFRLGEETAGNQRQYEILTKNLDLIGKLQSEEIAQTIGNRREVTSSSWQGSEYVYSAALLSTVPKAATDARVHLRSAERWLRAYFALSDDERQNSGRVDADDVTALALTKFNLDGVNACGAELSSWQPKSFAFEPAARLFDLFIDHGQADLIDEVCQVENCHIYIWLAAVEALSRVGKRPSETTLVNALAALDEDDEAIPRSFSVEGHSSIDIALITLAEAGLAANLDVASLIKQLVSSLGNRPKPISRYDHYGENFAILRIHMLSAFVDGKNLTSDRVFPSRKDSDRSDDWDSRNALEIISATGDAMAVRLNAIVGLTHALDEGLDKAMDQAQKVQSTRYQEVDQLPGLVQRIRFEAVLWHPTSSSKTLSELQQSLISQPSYLHELLSQLRAVFRCPHLENLRDPLEAKAAQILEAYVEGDVTDRTNAYVDLARAVLPTSKHDARVYLETAVQAVSQFGDEALERWTAVLGAAEASAREHEEADAQFVYRFVRCAEMMSQFIYDHYEWKRLVRAVVRLAPTSAFATVSRWRDRDVLSFESSIEPLIESLLQHPNVENEVAWPLTAFMSDYSALEMTGRAVSEFRSQLSKEVAFEIACDCIAKQGWTKHSLEQANAIAVSTGYVPQSLEDARTDAELYPFIDAVSPTQNDPYRNREPETPIVWDEVLNGLDYESSTSIHQCYEAFSKQRRFTDIDEFWDELLARCPRGSEVPFLEAYSEVRAFGFWDARRLIERLPDNWFKRPGSLAYFPAFCAKIAAHNVYDVLGQQLRNGPLSAVLHERVRPNDEVIATSALASLADSDSELDASEAFGAAVLCLRLIDSEESAGVLDFALQRFEPFVQAEHADGDWTETLRPPRDMHEAFAGLFWTALGAPESRIRWDAAHSVRRIAAINQSSLMAKLAAFDGKQSLAPFSAPSLPFYWLHARLYFVFALRRIALTEPESIVSLRDFILEYARGSDAHILVWRSSRDAALTLASHDSTWLSAEEVEELRSAAVTPFDVEVEEGGRIIRDTPFHETGEIIKGSAQFRAGHDISSYWNDALARVFGVPKSQIEDLVSSIIVSDWQIEPGKYGFAEDPRKDQWNKPNRRDDTRHSHGSYPRTDTYSFYLSFHGLMKAAGALLDKLPTVHWFSDSDPDPFSEWLRHHQVSNRNGYWLCDRRDPVPLVRRNWTHISIDEHWAWEITSGDFEAVIDIAQKIASGFPVAGSFVDVYGEHEEKIWINSVLTSADSASALVRAIQTSSSTQNTWLPVFEGDGHRESQPGFEVFSPLAQNYGGRGIDEFDKRSGDIPHPQHSPASWIFESLELVSSDTLERRWKCQTDGSEFTSHVWGDHAPSESEYSSKQRRGSLLSANIQALRTLMEIKSAELVFIVEIERSIPRHKREELLGPHEYFDPYRRVFRMNQKGQIFDYLGDH